MATKGVVIERIKGHLKKTEIVETGHAHFIVVGRIGCRSKSQKWLCQRLQLVHCDDSPLFNGWALSIVNACHLQRGRITTDRRVLRSKLDGETDFVVTRSRVTFRQTFETIEFAETDSRARHQIIEAARNILASERHVSVARAVGDTIFFAVGCNRTPLCANASGGCGRTLFEFKCVFEGCSAFLTPGCLPELMWRSWLPWG